MVAPGRLPAGRVIREPVSLRDLPATIVDMLGWSRASPFPGSSLAATWASPGPIGPRDDGLILAELGPLIEPAHEGNEASDWPSHAAALFTNSLVYIGHKRGHEELYDLDADPTQTRDLSDDSGSGPTLTRFRHDLTRVLGSRP
jgi:hypothetical protein